MSVSELEDHVWDELSPRRYAAGRTVVGRLVRRVVRNFPKPSLANASPETADFVMNEMSQSIIQEERKNYGMGIILSLILGALIQEIVKAIFRWWSQSKQNHVLMDCWQLEMQRNDN